MRKAILTIGVLLLALPAYAADLAVKAPPPSLSTFVSGSGFYLGAGASAAVASSNVSGNVLTLPGATGGNLYAAGGAVEVDAGYIWGNCLFGTWCQIEVD